MAYSIIYDYSFMNTEKLHQSVFDAYEGGPIGGACAIWLQGSIRLLTAYHISHDMDHGNVPRSLIFRNRTGRVTLRNIAFTMVRGAKDLSLSDPVDLQDALSIARYYAPSNSYITLGSVVPLMPDQNRVARVSKEPPIVMRDAPKQIYISSKGQRVDFGFSGKPVIDPQMNVAGVVIEKQRIRGKWYGVAETVRHRVFQG